MQHARAWLIAFVVLWFGWILLAGEWNLDEWIAATGAATVAATVGRRSANRGPQSRPQRRDRRLRDVASRSAPPLIGGVWAFTLR